MSATIQSAIDFHRSGRFAEAERIYRAILQQTPNQFEALHFLGILKLQQQQAEEAFTLISRAVATRPKAVNALCNLSAALLALKRYDEVLETCDKILRIDRDDLETISNRSNALMHLGRFQEAIAAYDKVVAKRPDHLNALFNRSICYVNVSRLQEAIRDLDRVLALAPDFLDALVNKANVYVQMEKYAEALALYDRILAVNPSNDLLVNRAVVLKNLNRSEEALEVISKILFKDPTHVGALNNKGTILLDLHQPDDALSQFQQALTISPFDADLLYNSAHASYALGRHPETIQFARAALAAAPKFIKGHCVLGAALNELGRRDEALASYDAALAIDPEYADALYSRAYVLKEMKRFKDAIVAYHKARAVKPDHPEAYNGLEAALAICDWQQAAYLSEGWIEKVVAGIPIAPFQMLAVCDDESLLRKCNENFIAGIPRLRLPPAGARRNGNKIRLAYLSADFHAHATAYLMAELFERHDREHFEIIGLSWGPDDGSDIRNRLIGAMHQFHDVRTKSARESARLLHELGVDIAVDLKGYTKDCRPAILAARPAPIQVSYLGYPSTMGTDFIDYMIADAITLPFDRQPHFSENIVHLPHCYQPNDTHRQIADRQFSRSDASLPTAGFVFCCFNNNYKITQTVFDVWMRLLANVPSSALWLLRDTTAAEDNLHREAQARGIHPARLVFADRLKLDEHLARHKLADIFLDTLPCGAHTTASDALWAGLPVLTCRGSTFAGRVAASLLHAVGLDDLVTQSLEEYEQLALKLATEPGLLNALRTRLTQPTSTHPLFDIDRYTRNIESAFSTMSEIQRRGEKPRNFAIASR